MEYIPTWSRDSYNSGIRKGEETGIRKGEEIGIRKGEEIGIQKAIIETLKTRFKHLPEKLELKIKGISDLQQLEKLISLAAGCDSLESFSDNLN